MVIRVKRVNMLDFVTDLYGMLCTLGNKPDMIFKENQSFQAALLFPMDGRTVIMHHLLRVMILQNVFNEYLKLYNLYCLIFR